MISASPIATPGEAEIPWSIRIVARGSRAGGFAAPAGALQATVAGVWRDLLGPEGALIFTNIRRGNAYRVWLEYLANWELTERDGDRVLDCCREAGIPAAAVRTDVV